MPVRKVEGGYRRGPRARCTRAKLRPCAKGEQSRHLKLEGKRGGFDEVQCNTRRPRSQTKIVDIEQEDEHAGKKD